MGLTPPVKLPCAPTTKTGNTEGQGAGPTRDEALFNAVSNALTIADFGGGHEFGRCPVQCPLRTISPRTPGAFTITEEGEFDISGPGGTHHLFYVKGSLAWTITRTCSKLQLTPRTPRRQPKAVARTKR